MPILRKFQVWKEPFRYVYKDPDTGRVFEEKSRDALVKLITNYRANNNLEPLVNVLAVLENYWCSLPENAGRCEPYTLKRSFGAYLKGGMTLVKDLLYPNTMRVSQEEANRRAEICAHCPHNVDARKTAVMLAADEIVDKYLGDKTKTPYDEQLGNCDICTCVLRFKVHIKGPFSNTPIQAEEMRRVEVGGQKCWQVDSQRV